MSIHKVLQSKELRTIQRNINIKKKNVIVMDMLRKTVINKFFYMFIFLQCCNNRYTNYIYSKVNEYCTGCPITPPPQLYTIYAMRTCVSVYFLNRICTNSTHIRTTYFFQRNKKYFNEKYVKRINN